MVIAPGISRASSPFGPFTVTTPSLIATETAEGTLMGAFPIRDMTLLPDPAEDLAADAALARLAVGHETLRRREHGDAEPAEHAGHFVGLAVDAQAGFRHALDAGDDSLAFGRVLQLDVEDL